MFQRQAIIGRVALQKFTSRFQHGNAIASYSKKYSTTTTQSPSTQSPAKETPTGKSTPAKEGQDKEGETIAVENENNRPLTPPKTLGHSSSPSSSSRSTLGDMDREKQKKRQEEEEREAEEAEKISKRQGELMKRLQVLALLGLAASAVIVIYLKRKEMQRGVEDEYVIDEDDFDMTSQNGKNQIGMESIVQMEKMVAASAARQQEEVEDFKQEIGRQYDDFYNRYTEERAKREKYTPSEEELRKNQVRQEEQISKVTEQEISKMDSAAQDERTDQVNAGSVTSDLSNIVDTTKFEEQILTLREKIKQAKAEMEKLERKHENDELGAKVALVRELEKNLAHNNKEHEITVAKHAQEVAEKLEEQKHELSLQYQTDNRKRVDVVDQLAARVHALNYVYYESSQFFDDMYELQKMSVGITTLQQALKTNGPLKPEIDALNRVNRVVKDELIESLLESIPQRVVVTGAPKLIDLERSFRKTKRQAQNASYAPEGLGFVGKIYAKCVSLLVINEESFVEGDDVSAALARAQYYLTHDRLDQAISEISQIESNDDVKEKLQHWLKDANDRLHVDQIDHILTNHLVNLARSRETFFFSSLDDESPKGE